MFIEQHALLSRLFRLRLPLSLLLLLPATCPAQTVTLPHYVLGEDVARTQVDILREKYRVVDTESGEVGLYDQELASLHLLKRLTNEGNKSRYNFYQMVDKSARGVPDKLEFVDGDFHRLSADAVVDGATITITPDESSKEVWSKKSEQHVSDYVRGEATWGSFVALASSQPFTLQQPVNINAPLLGKLGFTAATITLVAVGQQWQQAVAEFSLQGTLAKGHCQGRAWFSLDEGRPLQHYWDCYGHSAAAGRTIQQNTLQTRAWQYSDKTISQLSPTPRPQLHPNGPITGLAYSESLKRLLILSRSKVGSESWLTYWDSNRRQAILSRRVVGDRLALSANDKLAAIASPQGFIAGELQISDRFKPFGQVKPVKFDLDNKVLGMGLYGFYPITLSNQATIDIWNLGYDKRVASQQLEDKDQSLLGVAADGRIVTSNKQGDARLFQLKLDTSACKANEMDVSWCDGARLADFQQLNKVTIPAGNIVAVALHPQQPLMALTLDSFMVALFNYETGAYGLLEGSTVAFSADSNAVITDIGLYDLDGHITQRWEVNTAIMLDSGRTLTDAGKSQIFYQGSGVLESYSGVNQVHMRDRQSGALLTTIEAQTSPSLSLSHQGSILFTSSNDKVMAFDLAMLQAIKQEASVPQLQRMAISGEVFVLHTPEALISFKVAADGTTSKPIFINARVNDFALNNADLIYVAGDKLIRIKGDGDSRQTLYTAPAEIRSLAMLDNRGEQFALLLADGRVWLPQSDKIIAPGTTAASRIIADQENGQFYLSALSDRSGYWNSAIPLIRKFDSSGEMLLDLQAGWDSLTAFHLDRNGRLWGGSEAGRLLVWDSRTGRRLYEMDAHLDRINDLHLMEDGTMVSAANDGTIRLWHTDIPSFSFEHQVFTGAAMLELFDHDIKKRQPELLATLILDKQGGYVVAAGDGYYSASPGALNRTSFTEGDRILDYSQFDLWLNRPDILARRIAHSSQAQVKLLEQMVSFRRARHAGLPQALPSLEHAPQLTVLLPDAATATADLELPWQAQATGGARLSHLTIEINGVPLHGRQGLNITGKSAGTVDVPLSQGENNIRITVSDSNGVISSPTHLVVNRVGESRKPALYLLTIGVSDYGNDALDLNYADKDASDIAAYYQTHGGAFSAVHVKQLLNGSATRGNIMAAKQFLQQAKTDDRVIIFFAGHGFLDDDERYYFGTADIEPAAPQLKGLSYGELNSLVDGLASRYKLLMLDTCHSGEVAPLGGATQTALLGDVSARGFNVKRRSKPPAFEFSLEALQGRFTDLREATGAIVLSAAGGREYALENSEWGNGVFTASVLKGLNDAAADSNDDGQVAVSELRAFVYKEVQRLTKGEQKPTTRELNLTLDFAVN